MFVIQNSEGKFLTNHGMKKLWFTSSVEIAYIFDDIETAERHCKFFDNCVIVKHKHIFV